MPQPLESTAPVGAAAPSGSDELRRRVIELESQIAQERAQTAAKTSDLERSAQILRTALHDLQAEFKHLTEERERLRADVDRLTQQLDASRRRLVELTERPPQPPDPALPQTVAQLAAARDTATSLRERVAVLESVVAQRERDLIEARDLIDALEAAAGEAAATPPASLPSAATPTPAPAGEPTEDASEDRARAAEPPAPTVRVVVRTPETAGFRDDLTPRGDGDARGDGAAALGAPAEGDSELPEIPGIRIERVMSDGPGTLSFDGREIETRRAVHVRILPGILQLLDGAQLDALLLARHPNLIAVLAFGVCRLGPYLVLERCEGETGTAWVGRLGALPEKTALAVALEVARGMRHAAAGGTIHGDLSPDTIHVDASGRVRVSGTGLRRVLRPNDASPSAPHFASPERLRGQTVGDPRSDVYSLGAVLWYLLTGAPPCTDDPEGILRRHASGAPFDIREARADVSLGTAQLLRRMLASAPEARHRSWDQVLVDLEHRQPGVVSPEVRSSFEVTARRVIAARPWILFVVIAVPLVAAVAVHLALNRSTTPAERWSEARERAERLIDAGDVEGAKRVYSRFTKGVGDASIEEDARWLLERLDAK